jgi:hypothetical protein
MHAEAETSQLNAMRKPLKQDDRIYTACSREPAKNNALTSGRMLRIKDETAEVAVQGILRTPGLVKKKEAASVAEWPCLEREFCNESEPPPLPIRTFSRAQTVKCAPVPTGASISVRHQAAKSTKGK